jgi:F420-non-reducing hydrogenase iron-sulfur subunit
MIVEKINEEPKIIGFLCNWCSYAGADLAGVSRIQYPSNIRVIRVMCSGRVDLKIIVEALIQGIDGVIVAGCHPGDCHYLSGNYQTERRIKVLKKILARTKIDSGRVQLEWVSASEGQRFADVVRKFTDQIKTMGPNPVRIGENLNREILMDLITVRETVCDEKLRTLIGKEEQLTEKGNVYNEKVSVEEYQLLMDDIINTVFVQKKILQLTKENALSIKELAVNIGLSPRETLQHVVVLRKNNLITIAEIDNTTPKYLALQQQRESP